LSQEVAPPEVLIVTKLGNDSELNARVAGNASEGLLCFKSRHTAFSAEWPRKGVESSHSLRRLKVASAQQSVI
jgi:hypothetical protein